MNIMADEKETKDLTAGFAFIAGDKVPKRQVTDRLAEFRAEQAETRMAASLKVSKGLTGGKALTDNVVYPTQIEATRVASRAKALVNLSLNPQNLRGSVTVSGTEEDGFRWFLTSKEIPAEAEAEATA